MASKDELPRLEPVLQRELTGHHQLTHVETAEKQILPTAQDVDKEKREKSLFTEIASGIKLDHVVTQEKNVLPTADQIQAEKTN